MIVALTFLPLIGTKDPVSILSFRKLGRGIFLEARYGTGHVFAQNLPLALTVLLVIPWQNVL